jgi:hypothetical protein
VKFGRSIQSVRKQDDAMAIRILEDKQLEFGEGIGAYGFEICKLEEQDINTYWSGRDLESHLEKQYKSGLFLLIRQQ